MGIRLRRWAAVLVSLPVAGSGVSSSTAADAPAGAAARGAKLAYTCFGCHGIADYRNAYPNYRVPRLGGQHAPYIVAALGEYRAGTRAHPTMKGQASSLGEQDIRDLAAFFAGTRDVGAGGGAPIGTAPAAAGVCAACHGASGVGTTADYPTLAGQYPDYLEQALKAYQKGSRQNPIMAGFAATLKDEDVRALARYFAAQQPGLSVPPLPSAP
jgi:cytochrome c553